MKLAYDERGIKLYQGDCREVLRSLPEKSVHCCVTSPPFYGLRDYNLPPLVWGGDLECNHEWGKTTERKLHTGSSASEKALSVRGAFHGEQSVVDQFCVHCGAWRGSLGLEPTLGLYVEHLVEVFHAVKKTLRNNGALWLNLGDSYSQGGGKQVLQTKNASHGLEGMRAKTPDMPSKQLLGIPWRVALALQADGWWLRSDIIWEKSNCMPSSVRDRPTTSHEYIFLLAKSKRYYYDQDAIREPQQMASRLRTMRGWDGDTKRGYPEGPQSHIDRYFNKSYEEAMALPGRNRRTIWTIPTKPFRGAHFAVFPSALIEPCILAGTSERGVCPECGAPWERVREGTGHVNRREPAHCPNNSPTKVDSTGWAPTTRATDTWRSTCDHDTEPIPATVLDPFIGSGTTAIVAHNLGRNCIGIDLSETYIEDIAIPRIEKETAQMALC